jgi:hypothetical protein
MIYEYFPEEFIQLQIEIGHHPLLIQRLQKHEQLEMEVIFAEVAHYCGFAINGTYEPDDLLVIADKFIWELRGMAVKDAIHGLSDDWGKEAWKFGIH